MPVTSWRWWWWVATEAKTKWRPGSPSTAPRPRRVAIRRCRWSRSPRSGWFRPTPDRCTCSATCRPSIEPPRSLPGSTAATPWGHRRRRNSRRVPVRCVRTVPALRRCSGGTACPANGVRFSKNVYQVLAKIVPPSWGDRTPDLPTRCERVDLAFTASSCVGSQKMAGQSVGTDGYRKLLQILVRTHCVPDADRSRASKRLRGLSVTRRGSGRRAPVTSRLGELSPPSRHQLGCWSGGFRSPGLSIRR